MGDGREALKRALELDPLSVMVTNTMAWHSYMMRQYDDTIEYGRRTLDIEPSNYMSHYYRYMAFRQKQRHEEAIDELKEMVSLMGFNRVVGAIESGYRESGHKGAALRAAQAMASIGQGHFREPFGTAIAYAHGDDNDRAFEWLEHSVEERTPALIYLKAIPDWDSLRDDPRFQDLLRRMNFPD